MNGTWCDFCKTPAAPADLTDRDSGDICSACRNTEGGLLRHGAIDTRFSLPDDRGATSSSGRFGGNGYQPAATAPAADD